MLEGEGEGGEEHGGGGDRAAEVEEEEGVPKRWALGVRRRARLPAMRRRRISVGPKGPGGEVEAGEGVGGEEAFCRQEQKRKEHGEGDGGVEEAGRGEAGHEGGGAEEVGGVVDVEAVTGGVVGGGCGRGCRRGCRLASWRGDEGVDEEERGAVVAGEGVGGSGGELGEEAEEG